MSSRFHDLTFTPTVRALQTRDGSRAGYERASEGPVRDAVLTPREADFLAARDSFYLASSSETGWPYIQHRGGPPGFVHALDDTSLGFADFAGNRQFITAGNVEADDRVALIFVDYAARRRLKLLGHLEMLDPDAHPDLAERLAVPGERARVERLARVRIVAFDWNCPQHITPRYTRDEVLAAVAPFQARIAELEEALATARRT
ncbi:pyridoxamine 5'-phosphate oxidase family protein [Marinivivus vitaminiproducens]|uniref:pyridoxamine 5'-phosphate oxidase family protein n=1 Tax=Marinivivus vitaminiproducens TaxID=3035935 RepID=UPI0027A01F59|nr:pyridoxamine 5'-phosphate oxidase family protein [Geminicoccaceae bacterium SCSIO 64248]